MFQSRFACARTLRRLFRTLLFACLQITSGLLPSLLRSAFGRRQFYSSPACFRQSDRDRLPGRTGAMLPFPHVLNFFADKLAGLGTRRFTFFLIFGGPLQRLLFRHPCPPQSIL